MVYDLKTNNIEELYDKWVNLQKNSSSRLIFSSPEWTGIWWQCFGNGYAPYLAEVSDNSTSIGIAPMMIKGDIAFLMGSENICDYLDFIILKGNENKFFNVLINNLQAQGIKKIELLPVREDSSVITGLADFCKKAGMQVETSKIDVSPYVNLPNSWDGYLSLLNNKQRHELRRKMRRLREMGEIEYTSNTIITEDDRKLFFQLFRESREDKAEFLTADMENFLTLVLNSMSEKNYLRFNVLRYNKKPIAVTICFDYNNEMLLYNSGFDREYNWLSAGIISKAMAIEDGIKTGKNKFDFLKGSEAYKYHLGGLDLPIYKCTIILNQADR